MRQLARIYLFTLILASGALPVSAQTVNAIINVSNFVGQAVNVFNMKVTPVAPGATYVASGKTFLSDNIPLMTRANTPSLTNGTATVNNLYMDYAYSVKFSDGYSTTTVQFFPDSHLIGTNTTIYAASYNSVNIHTNGTQAIPYLPAYTSTLVSNVTFLTTATSITAGLATNSPNGPFGGAEVLTAAQATNPPTFVFVPQNGATGQIVTASGVVTVTVGTSNQFTPANVLTLAGALQAVPAGATNWIPPAIAANSTNDPSGAAKQATNGLANGAFTANPLTAVPAGATNWVPTAISASIAASNLLNAATITPLNGVTGQVTVVSGQLNITVGTSNQFSPANAATLAAALPASFTNNTTSIIYSNPTAYTTPLQVTNIVANLSNTNQFGLSTVTNIANGAYSNNPAGYLQGQATNSFATTNFVQAGYYPTSNPSLFVGSLQFLATGLSVSNRVAFHEWLFGKFTNTLFLTGFGNAAVNGTNRWSGSALTNISGNAYVSNQVVYAAGVAVYVFTGYFNQAAIGTNGGTGVGLANFDTNRQSAGANITLTATDGGTRFDVVQNANQVTNNQPTVNFGSVTVDDLFTRTNLEYGELLNGGPWGNLLNDGGWFASYFSGSGSNITGLNIPASTTNWVTTAIAAVSTNDPSGAAAARLADAKAFQGTNAYNYALLTNNPILPTPYTTNSGLVVTGIVQNVAAPMLAAISTNDPSGAASAAWLSNSNLSSTLAKSATNFTLGQVAASSTNEPSGAVAIGLAAAKAFAGTNALNYSNLTNAPPFVVNVFTTNSTPGALAIVTNIQAIGVVASNAWSLSGNTVVAGQFLGTVNSTNLLLESAGSILLRLTIGGSVIGGSGSADSKDQYDFIGGGFNNTNAGMYGVIGGGFTNINKGNYGVVGGGNQNINNSDNGVIAGGNNNHTSGNAGATLSGGAQNASVGAYSVIGGGSGNICAGGYSTVSGGQSNNAGSYGFIGSGFNNFESDGYGAIGGGYGNIIGAIGAAYNVIGGGLNNTITNGWYDGILSGTGNYLAATNSVALGSRNILTNDNSLMANDGIQVTSAVQNSAYFSFKNGFSINTNNPRGYALNVSGGINATGYSLNGSNLSNFYDPTNSAGIAANSATNLNTAMNTQVLAMGLSLSNRVSNDEDLIGRFTNTLFLAGYGTTAVNGTNRWSGTALTNISAGAYVSNQIAYAAGIAVYVWPFGFNLPAVATNSATGIGTASFGTNLWTAGTNITVSNLDGAVRYDVPNTTSNTFSGLLDDRQINYHSNTTNATGTNFGSFTGNGGGLTNLNLAAGSIPGSVIVNAGGIIAPTRTLYVSPIGNNSTAQINNTNLTFTLDGAVVRATNSGDTVFIFPGTYWPTGYISMARSTKLIGYSRASVIINQTNQISIAFAFFHPQDNVIASHFTWTATNDYFAFMGNEASIPVSFTNVLLDDLGLMGGFDIYYGEGSPVSTNRFTIQNSTIQGPWDFCVPNFAIGGITSKNNQWIGATATHNSHIFGTLDFTFIDSGSTFYNMGQGIQNDSWASALAMTGSRFVNTRPGDLNRMFKINGSYSGTFGNFIDVDNSIIYNISPGGVSYTQSTNNCFYQTIVLFGFSAPDLAVNNTNFTLQFATGDILHNQSSGNTRGTWTNGTGYVIKLNDPFDIQLSGLNSPCWSIDQPGNQGSGLYQLINTQMLLTNSPITNAAWQVNLGSGTPGSSWNTNLIPLSSSSIELPSLFNGAIQADSTWTNLTYFGNASGLTNLAAAGISTNGSTASQILASVGGKAVWTNATSALNYRAGIVPVANLATATTITFTTPFSPTIGTNYSIALTPMGFGASPVVMAASPTTNGLSAATDAVAGGGYVFYFCIPNQ